jgi:hypothetical protein
MGFHLLAFVVVCSARSLSVDVQNLKVGKKKNDSGKAWWGVRDMQNERDRMKIRAG